MACSFTCEIRYSGAIILKITYGYTIDPIGTDHLVALVDEVDSIFSESAQPGRWLVDTIPACEMLITVPSRTDSI